MAIIPAVAIAIVIFYYAFDVGKPESLLFTSTENVCSVNKDYFLGPQYQDVSPFLRPFVEALLKSSFPVWSFLPFNIPKPLAYDPCSRIFNSESIAASQNERRYFATNQCERVSVEHQFSAVSETVRRYLTHTKKLKEPYRYESPISANINEALIDRKSVKLDHDGKLQMDLHVVIVNSSENWNSMKIKSSKHPESIKMEISKLQKPPSTPELILPTPLFSANHRLIEPELGLLPPVPSPELLVKKEIKSVSEIIMDLVHVEKKCLKVIPDIKKIKSLGKKRTKLRYSTDLTFFAELQLRESKMLLGSDSEMELRKPKKGKSEVFVISSVKKAFSKTVERAKVHRNKLLEQFSRAIDKIARRNRPKTFQMGKKNIGKDRCVLNSTCNVLASLAQTLAGITLFPAIVGQTNAAKYINSLLDLSACTGSRLVCEKCWWTRECCPKERCTFLPWQRHFNTKRFLASQGHKMFEAFEELGWSMPGKKHKAGGDKPKFKLNYPRSFAGSEKEMRFRQNKKKLVERYSRKSDVQGHIH
ncbi:hypothetical protein, variant [Loa loa]|nr:hypothetical protein, variant [Loa loa]EJD75749.1 hypothetical protein, variant [Loa loa]